MQECRECKSPFEITDADRKFYAKISVPEPQICPQCRQQQRCAWRNERELYHRKCDLSGKQIISIYSSDKPFPVYSQEEYWGDKWDALDYEVEFDFTRPFFEQFNELMQKVPRLAIVNKQAENSDYCNYSFANKNCYLTFGNHYEEDCLYGHYSTKNKNCTDYLCLYESELCYECIYSKRCHKSIYLDQCEDCDSCYFSVDLKGCKDCVFCSNLRHKEYFILNKQYSKEEYFKKLEAFEFGGYKRFSEAKHFFLNDFRRRFPVKNVFQKNCENCKGGTHENCKNLEYCFDCTNCEDCAYGFQMDETYSSMDMTCMGYDRSEVCYQIIGCSGIFNCIACDSCWQGNDLFYCNLCFSSQNCFGCISLKHKKYCILNKQYTKEEYENLVPRIIEHMQKTGEWGNFFPMNISPFGYNETIVAYDFSLIREEAELKGLKWHEEIEAKSYKGPKYEISDTIQDVKNDILDKILTCETSGKPYKIIPQELKFYKKLNLPIPRKSPAQRHLDRIRFRNPRKLFNRKCANCSFAIQTTYSPDRPEKVYCEECYLKTVY